MKWLLIAIFCISAASAATLVGQKRCTWGPSYWCQRLETAKECRAVSHCAAVWKSQPTSQPSSTESCLICKGLIQDLKTIVAAKRTQAEIKKLALEACNLMKKEKTVEEVCNTVVVLFLPEILDLIEKEVDSGKICGVLRLCDNSKLMKKFARLQEILKVAKSLKSSQNCDECKMAVAMIKGYLAENATQIEIIQFVENDVCPRLPGEMGSVCKSVAAEILPQVFESLNAILDPNEVCGYIGLCPKSMTKSFVQKLLLKFVQVKKVRANPVECDLCKAGITDLRNQLRDSSVEAEVSNFLKNEVCTHFGSLAVQCQQGVTQYLPLLFKLLITNLDPDTTCKSLGLCAPAIRKTPMLAVTPAKTLSVHRPRASPQCILCEFVMKEIDRLLLNNHTEAAITSALDKVCTLMPSTIRSECTDFVQQYASVVIKLLANNVAPQAVCTAIGLCAGDKESVMSHKTPEEACDLMVRYVRVLAKGLHMNFRGIVEKVCNFVPISERASCRSFVLKYKHSMLTIGKQSFVLRFHPGKMCKRIMEPTRPRPNGLVQLLGSSKCTYGPAYWCSRYENAVECNALEHCRERVWKKKSSLM